jgi:hypothetical protein
MEIKVRGMGFGSFIGGILLGILAVRHGIVALFLFAFGWYSYKSAKPRGTINVHNQ